MVTAVELDTGSVVTVKVALVLPLSTVTLPGTVATHVLLLDSDTTVSPGAGPLSVTVPVEVLPPTTVDGFKVREERTGMMLKLMTLETPPPGVGLKTVTWTAPATAMSDAGIEASSSVALT